MAYLPVGVHCSPIPPDDFYRRLKAPVLANQSDEAVPSPEQVLSRPSCAADIVWCHVADFRTEDRSSANDNEREARGGQRSDIGARHADPHEHCAIHDHGASHEWAVAATGDWCEEEQVVAPLPGFSFDALHDLLVKGAGEEWEAILVGHEADDTAPAAG